MDLFLVFAPSRIPFIASLFDRDSEALLIDRRRSLEVQVFIYLIFSQKLHSGFTEEIETLRCFFPGLHCGAFHSRMLAMDQHMKGLLLTHIMLCTDRRWLGQLLRERSMPFSCRYGFCGKCDRHGYIATPIVH